MLRKRLTGFGGETPNVLDVGRGIAIVSVMYGHALAPWFMNAGDHFSQAAFLQWKFGASFMMALFFFLSGVGSCRSAQVDPMLSPIPTTIISSSPYTVDSTSLFGDRLAVALEAASTDPNCDGLVTDQELFDALQLGLAREASTVQNRAYPKLRRNAPSHIPLPVRARSNSTCAQVREEMERFGHGAANRDLGNALLAQLSLSSKVHQRGLLPQTPCDYFIIDGDTAGRADVEKRARSAGLCTFPSSDLGTAERVAKFSTFAEVYRLSVADGWTHVIRLRDGALMTVARTNELEHKLPRRRALSVRDVVERDERCQFRYDRLAPVRSGVPVHCAESEGQCFLESCAGEIE